MLLRMRGWLGAVLTVLLSASAAVATETQAPLSTARASLDESEPLLDRAARLQIEALRLDLALHTLSETSGVALAFSPSRTAVVPHVTCRCRDATVQEALSVLLQGSGFGYRELERQIVITPAYPVHEAPLMSPAVMRSARLAADVEPTIRLAQEEGRITGRVVDAETEAPMPSVQIHLVGTDIGTLTGDNGRYLLTNVPEGEHRIRAERIGYRPVTRQVEIRDGTSTVDFRLSHQALGLDEIVVTGTAGGTQARALGNTIARVEAGDVVDLAPVSDIQQLLSTQVAGLRAFSGAGNVGTGAPVRIRGGSSLTLSGSPLVYVDGVRIDSNENSGSYLRGGNINRLSDINPEDIESVEVIKGPAAATLYGTEASNGVIQIRTKTGRVGAPTWDVTMKQGATWMPNPEQTFPATYDVDPATGEVRRFHLLEAERERGLGSPFSTGHDQSYAFAVRGGTPQLRYRLSSEFDHTEGVVDWNWKNAFHSLANLMFTPNEQFNINTSMGFVRSQTSFEGPGGGGVVDIPSQIIWTWPRVADDAQRRGWRWATPEVIEQVEAIEDMDRFTGSLSLKNNPVGWFTHRIAGGADIGSAQFSKMWPRFPAEENIIGSDGLGRKEKTARRVSNFTVDYGATATVAPATDLEFETSVGAQYYLKRIESTYAEGLEFPVPGPGTVASAASAVGSEDFLENKTFGVFLQEQVGWRNRVFLTGAVRGDDNSAFGENFDFVVYPKFSASWVLHEEPFWHMPVVNALKLRAAWGRAGQQPDVFAARRLYAPVTAYDESPGLTPEAVGNPDLKPEVGEEIELGFDAGLLQDRISMEFTYYQQRTKDAIVARTLSPSLGFPGVQFVNIGELSNRGIEIGVRGSVLQRRSFGWEVGFNLSTNHSEVVDLGGLPPISLGGRQRHQEGYPIGSLWAPKILHAEFNPDGSLNASCEGADGEPRSCEGAPRVYIGPSRPTWEGAAHTTLNFLKDFTLYAVVDYMGGFYKYSGDLGASHILFRNSKAIHERSYAELAVLDEIFNNMWVESGLMKAGFAKLRRLALSYSLPERLAGWVGASRGSVNLGLNNALTLWTAQEGTFGRRELDPEMQSRSDWGAYYQTFMPAFRQFTTTVKLSF